MQLHHRSTSKIRRYRFRRTIRLRLTLTYGGLFLLSGVGLLTITYLLVRSAGLGPVVTAKGPHGATIRGAVAGASHLPSPTGRGLKFITGARGAQVVRGSGGLTAKQLQAQSRRLIDQSMQQQATELHRLLVDSAIALACMAAVSMALGWIVAGKVLRPLRGITTSARQISATNLHRRLRLKGPNDELKELGDTFDELLARLESSFQSQRQFVANASHELRSPLARQRTLIQVALDDPQASADSLRRVHERVLASGAQEERLIDALLILTRGQAGVAERRLIDLSIVASEVLPAFTEQARVKNLSLTTWLSAAPIAGDPRLINRLIYNLVDNALRYNVDHGEVYVVTGITKKQSVLSVINSGPEIPATEIGRLLLPFQRLGGQRVDNGDGCGLGMSIVQAIGEAHDAELVVQPRLGGGLEVIVGFALAHAEESVQSPATVLAPV